jgi:hypothetical protein
LAPTCARTCSAANTSRPLCPEHALSKRGSKQPSMPEVCQCHPDFYLMRFHAFVSYATQMAGPLLPDARLRSRHHTRHPLSRSTPPLFSTSVAEKEHNRLFQKGDKVLCLLEIAVRLCTPDTEGSQVALRSKMSIFAPDSPPGRRFALPVGESVPEESEGCHPAIPSLYPFLARLHGCWSSRRAGGGAGVWLWDAQSCKNA